jgi:hypothetical protein
MATHTLIVEDFPMELEVESGMPPNTPAVSVCFVLCPMRDEMKSRTAGHDVFVDIEHVRIAIPGDKQSLFFQPATDAHRKRFPVSYGKFKNRTAGVAVREGMPIENWAQISRSLAMTLKAINVHTVEDLAVVHDTHIDRIGDGRSLRAKAQAWVAQAKDSAATTKLAAEKQALEDRIKAMEQMISDMRNPPAVNSQSKPSDDVEADVVAAARRPRGRSAQAAA